MIDNKDGTVTDNESGLMWQKGEAGEMSWTEAMSYCENLTLAGHTDWRLPDNNELRTLKNAASLSDAVASWYWSSTKGDFNVGEILFVEFGRGESTSYSHNSYNYYVRCVRGDLNERNK